VVPGVPVLDLVAKPDEEAEIGPHGVLLVRPLSSTHGATPHPFGSPFTFTSLLTLPKVVQYR
jgi:hypothetical protein